ncbi:MAG: hypothetical protein WCT77_11570 [Bacteroidota bacterium]
MDNTLTIIILGLYTLVYVIVFFIQKSQIDKQKDVINSMKSFIDIFKIDEVKKYVEIKTETMKLNVENIIEIKRKEFIKEISEDAEKAIRKIADDDLNEFKDKFKDKYNELWNELLDFIKLLPEDIRNQYIENNLTFTKESFLLELKDSKDEITE